MPKMFLVAGLIIGFSSVARADMVEVKGKGILNGKVLSQSAGEMKFKDAAGAVHVFSKTDVLYADISSGTGEEDKPVAQKIRGAMNKFLQWVRRISGEYKKFTQRTTDEVLKKMSKPLDRSRVNAKTDSLSVALDQASQASAAMTRKNLQIAAALKQQEDANFPGSTGSDRRKGRFTSLN